MKQLELDKNVGQIKQWISENRSHRYICKQLDCAHGTLNVLFKRNGIEYNGNQGHKGEHLKTTDEIFKTNTHYSSGLFIGWILDRKILEYKCDECGINEWNNKPIRLEIDHINGVRSDNRQENLRFLCPNCHSQTPTFRGKNKNGYLKITDDQMIDALKNSPNIYNALIKLNLAPRGANYARAKKLLESL